jgi:hypothetical protein
MAEFRIAIGPSRTICQSAEMEIFDPRCLELGCAVLRRLFGGNNYIRPRGIKYWMPKGHIIFAVKMLDHSYLHYRT